MPLHKRTGEGRAGSGSPQPFETCSFMKGYPTVVEFLCVTAWPDGSSRVPGSLVIFSEENVVKACLTDKDSGSLAFVSAKTVTSLFTAMEKGLSNDSLDWRASRSPPAGKRR